MPLPASELRALAQAYLDELALTPELGSLAEPMRHALGGKLVRPVLCLATGDAIGARPEQLLPAAAAVELISDGETVILDSGTTTAEIAKLIRGLKFQSLNVITNALNIAVLLASAPFINLIIPGGVLRRRSWSLSGPSAENAIRDLQAHTLFLGVDSLDPEVGLMTPYVLEAQLNAQMIRIASRVIAVTDSSKLLRRNLSVISTVDQVDLLITDRDADARCIEAIRSRGVDVRMV